MTTDGMKGTESGSIQEGNLFLVFLIHCKQGWAPGQCSRGRRTSLQHSLTLPPNGLKVRGRQDARVK